MKKANQKKAGWPRGILFLILILGVVSVHQCRKDLPFPDFPNLPAPPKTSPVDTVTVDTPPPAPVVKPTPEPPPPIPKTDTTPKTRITDSLLVYAEPWGGRHFDSVKVEIFCREDCLVLYSFNDSSHFQTYDKPLQIKRTTDLWITGIDTNANQFPPTEVRYVIKKRQGDCPKNMMPYDGGNTEICMDVYEWPNLEGAVPVSSVSHMNAVDSCASLGKRLCTWNEWSQACSGTQNDTYPYGSRYNENYCPAKEPEPQRSGRYPACRSYYGLYDMTGNLWEWTSTPSKTREDYFLVAGGNWETANQATCSLSKWSFFPQNKYPHVGFRCCKDL